MRSFFFFPFETGFFLIQVSDFWILCSVHIIPPVHSRVGHITTGRLKNDLVLYSQYFRSVYDYDINAFGECGKVWSGVISVHVSR